MKKSALRNQHGQFVVEGILLMVVLLGAMTLMTTKIRELGLVSKLVTGPWDKIAGMTENGVWAAPSDASRKQHPNTYNRIFTPED
ncbi:MAG: hypothetical protein KF789_14645 [Bdellovibrionaceae bacterium]|nr:hypothetical protein [Pseudobdellovibrionaceae bacterium]